MILREPNFTFDEHKDSWKVDWDKLSQSLNEKTKLIIINTPHNPTGK